MADQKTETAKSTPNPLPRNTNEIPVKVIRFVTTAFIELPGSAGNSAITTRVGDDKRRAGHVVTYVPQMRHHRVEHFAPNSDTPSSTHYVHEVHVASWEAA